MVTGKGGVGKTSLAAALGMLLARSDRAVAVIETDPRESLHQMMGTDPSAGELRRVGGGLWFQNLDARAAVDRVVERQLRIGWLARRVEASPVYDQFASGAPGVKELSLLGQVVEMLAGGTRGGPDLDLIVLDAPATGHGRSLLSAPALVAEVISEGPFGRLTKRVADFVGDAESTSEVVVTLAEEMAINETLELIDGLEGEMGREVGLTVVNAIYPRRPRRAKERDALDRLWTARRAVNERQMKRLDEAGLEPLIHLPLLPIDRGLELTESLAEAIQAAAEAGEARP